MKLERSKALQKKAHNVIPGGSHTYAKGDDQFPELFPGLIARGKGSHVWDVDGNEYIEYNQGGRAVVLGHAFEPVVAAARRELENGSNFSRPAEIEVTCAETFLSMITSADMVKFCKDGSTATSGAIKIARAATGRDHIAFCKDHPFFSINDWFIGTTPMNAGIPKAISDLSLSFRYNDIESVKTLFQQNPGKIAGVILEPAKYGDPTNNFLHEVKRICHENGTVFILDEMITGFRWHNGGAQKYYNIVPDLSTFGKGLANGFSVSALAGKRDLMELGGLDHDKERVFLLSTTHGAETHALAAAIATMKVYETEPVIEHLFRQGERLRHGAEEVIARHGLKDKIPIIGLPCCLVFGTQDRDGKGSQALRSLFLQETAKRGVLMGALVLSYSHTDADIDKTVEAIDGAAAIYKMALEEGAEKYLVGQPSRVVMRRYNHRD
jgi:glutamate-1-semialdehyde 2,1-aminomutase